MLTILLYKPRQKFKSNFSWCLTTLFTFKVMINDRRRVAYLSNVQKNVSAFSARNEIFLLFHGWRWDVKIFDYHDVSRGVGQSFKNCKIFVFFSVYLEFLFNYSKKVFKFCCNDFPLDLKFHSNKELKVKKQPYRFDSGN